MRQKIKNVVYIAVEGIDLTTLSNIEFYIQQRRTKNLFFQYTPTVINANTMFITIPKADADKLEAYPVKIQFAFTRDDGTPGASDVYQINVDELLREDGYYAG